MTDRDVESHRSRAWFVTTLRRMADAIEAGGPIRLQVAGQRLIVPADATFSLEHEVENGEAELELQMRWQEGPDVPAKPSKRAAKRKRAPKRKNARGSKRTPG